VRERAAPDGAAVQETTSSVVDLTTPCNSIRSPCTAELRRRDDRIDTRPACGAPILRGEHLHRRIEQRRRARADETRKDAPPTRMPASLNTSMATL